MEKRKYTAPLMEEMEFESIELLVVSGEVEGENIGYGGEGDGSEIPQ